MSIAGQCLVQIALKPLLQCRIDNRCLLKIENNCDVSLPAPLPINQAIVLHTPQCPTGRGPLRKVRLAWRTKSCPALRRGPGRLQERSARKSVCILESFLNGRLADMGHLQLSI